MPPGSSQTLLRHGEVGTGCVGLALVGQSGWARAGSSGRATPEPSAVPTLSLGTPALSPQHPKALPTLLHTWHRHKTLCQCLMHQQRARQDQIKLPVTKETATLGTLVQLPAILPQPQIQRHPGSCRGRREGPEGAGTPCPQPVIPAAPSQMLKRHNANSLALWPPRRCHGAVAENKHNSPHVFSAPSTPRPSAPAPELTSRDLPWLCQSHIPPIPGNPRWSRACLSRPWGRAARSWFRGLTRDTQGWQGIERRWKFGQECHMER